MEGHQVDGPLAGRMTDDTDVRGMDVDIVVQAQNGDRAAFEALTVASHPRLYRAALGILRDQHLAEDATQQALIEVWRYLRRLRDPAKYEAWSYRLLVRACVAEGKGRPQWVPEAEMRAADEPRTPDAFLAVVDRDELEHGFERLSVEHRAVIVLRYLLDMPLEEVADVLDVRVGTVGSRLNRAMQSLRAALEADARPTTQVVSEQVAER
jgi:RNA polymerase sigma-70 factor (ECF subfamily)